MAVNERMGSVSINEAERPTRLRIEHGPRLLGTGFDRPRLSWWLPGTTTSQLAYEVVATVDGEAASSGQVASDQSVLVPWPFAPLGSRSQVSWRVRTCAASGWSEWSESCEFETALLSFSDWSAKFIGSNDDPAGLPPKGERPAVYFHRTFSVEAQPIRARVYATAHGIYELHLDGQRLGDLELTPGFTAYRSHLEYQTFDLTDQMTPGQHTLTATVSDGWWRGAVGFTHQDCCYGKGLGFLAQVELMWGNEDIIRIGTDGLWRVSFEGPIRASDLMEGESVDQRVPFPPGTGWRTADVIGDPDSRLTVSPAPATRRIREYRPVKIDRNDGCRQVADIGANINGWVRLNGSMLGSAGTRIRLRHGETLGEDGDVDTKHLASFDYFTNEPIDVGQVDEVVSVGVNAPDFEPRHTTHGFQFVCIEGAGDITPADVTGILVHSDLQRTGWFSCSDERLNKLHEATVLSFVDNACEIPTDCPTRERSGFTGDWQIFVPTGAFLYDVAGFSSRWLRDLTADQWDDGRVPNFVPDPHGVPGKENSVAASHDRVGRLGRRSRPCSMPDLAVLWRRRDTESPVRVYAGLGGIRPEASGRAQTSRPCGNSGRIPPATSATCGISGFTGGSGPSPGSTQNPSCAERWTSRRWPRPICIGRFHRFQKWHR